MKKNAVVKKIVLGIALILWMACIFLLSAESSQDSTDRSISVTKIIYGLFFNNDAELSEEEQYTIVEDMEGPLRKIAHAAEYAVLGALSWLNATLYIKRNIKPGAAAAALTLCAIYAVSDELHQFFVPGRSPEARDILIDILGAAAGIAICLLADRMIRRKRPAKAG